MKCSHTGHTLPHSRSCYSLSRGIRHLERSFHLSSTHLHLITSTHNLGGLSPPREDYHLSLSWGIITSPVVDFGLLHQYVQKSDLLSLLGVLHPLPLLCPIIILV